MNILPLIPDITVELATRMLPYAPRAISNRISAGVARSGDTGARGSADALMALATIGAETGAFQPVSEGQDRFNTSSGGHPFDLYDSRADLGNLGPPDGERFKGRGFIQLTGRCNYALHGAAIDWASIDRRSGARERSERRRAVTCQFPEASRIQDRAALIATICARLAVW